MTPKATHQEALVCVMDFIKKCNNDFEFEAAGQLIEVFKKKFPRELQAKGLLVDKLNDLIMERFPPQKNIGA